MDSIEKEQFLTVKSSFVVEIDKIKGSRFIGRVLPVGSRDEAELELEKVRKSFYDATHNCFAYKVGLGKDEISRYSDDGEPSGTAGKPIFSVIEGSGLTNILVVSTRYFGGTKLGTGGLIKAYTESAKAAIEGCERKVVEIFSNMEFSYHYDDTSLVMSMISRYEAKIIDEKFSDSASVKLRINRAFVEKFKEELFDKSNGKIEAALCF
ncbi:MAG: YigZ family protein [Candidatus Cloacimonadota bacterium]|nr:MAG: YigZ family protein [Candidatus Cloacimonadota bacterium]PIE78757.1 MAG: YigZ family protein [Candidatus Delongbacteria bacterium]